MSEQDTLMRDLFAAAALVGLIQRVHNISPKLAVEAYKYADAMMDVREETVE